MSSVPGVLVSTLVVFSVPGCPLLMWILMSSVPGVLVSTTVVSSVPSCPLLVWTLMSSVPGVHNVGPQCPQLSTTDVDANE